METVQPAVTLAQEAVTRFANLHKTLTALGHLHGEQKRYATHVVLHFMCVRDGWPKVAEFSLTYDEAKHARRAVTTAYMADLDEKE
jgi:hypothetical protein